MWALHWWDETVTTPNVEEPRDYRPFRYFGSDTWLELPEYQGVSEYKFIPRFEIVNLPPSWPWVIRALDENRLEAIA